MKVIQVRILLQVRRVKMLKKCPNSAVVQNPIQKISKSQMHLCAKWLVNHTLIMYIPKWGCKLPHPLNQWAWCTKVSIYKTKETWTMGIRHIQVIHNSTILCKYQIIMVTECTKDHLSSITCPTTRTLINNSDYSRVLIEVKCLYRPVLINLSLYNSF